MRRCIAQYAEGALPPDQGLGTSYGSNQPSRDPWIGPASASWLPASASRPPANMVESETTPREGLIAGRFFFSVCGSYEHTRG